MAQSKSANSCWPQVRFRSRWARTSSITAVRVAANASMAFAVISASSGDAAGLAWRKRRWSATSFCVTRETSSGSGIVAAGLDLLHEPPGAACVLGDAGLVLVED